MADRKNVPFIILLLQDIRKCQRFGFGDGHPIREAVRDMIRIEQPKLKARIEKTRIERELRNRKPVQMRLW